MATDRKKITVHTQQGVSVYKVVALFQTELFNKNLELKNAGQQTENHLIFSEFEPTYTIGKNGKRDNMLLNPEAVGAVFHETDRGGDITFHGPGQLVIYPVFDLDNFGIGTAEFVAILETSVINTLAHFNITATRLSGAAGIWVDVDTYPKKICAIGIKVSRHVTMHGIAINVNTDLSWFAKIVPCGLADKGVASIYELTKKKVSLAEVATIFHRELTALLS
jgi:lipoyl(octanoyl) transferase